MTTPLTSGFPPPISLGGFWERNRRRGAMKRWKSPEPAELTQADDLRDLVRIGDFLAPEAHRPGGMHGPPQQ